MLTKIKITDEMKKIASKNRYEELTNGREYVLPTSKFWAGENQFQNYIGNLGELVFEQFLLNNSIKYEKDILYLNHGDHFDFKINEKTYDVKTGHFKYVDINRLKAGDVPANYKFLISEKQCDKPVDFYVNIQLDPPIEYAFIIGFIPKDDIKKYPVVKTDAMLGPAIPIPLSDLLPLTDLLNLKIEDEARNSTVHDWM